MSRFYIDAELTSMIDEHQPEPYQHEENDAKSGTNGSFEKTIETLNVKFTDVLLRMLNRICALGCNNNYEKLLNVLCRLDFNLFYTDIMVKQNADKPALEQDVSG